eukprot:2492192-Amphidinium_carterae.1
MGKSNSIGSADFFAACSFAPAAAPRNKKSKHYVKPALMDSVTAIFDGKSAGHLYGAAVTEMRRHLYNTGAAFGLLYDYQTFQLLIASGEVNTNRALAERHSGSWNQPGVVMFLSDQCRTHQPAHEVRLRLCLSHSDTKLLGFLGRGGFGSVFKVRKGNKHMALKVVEKVDRLKIEVCRLQKLNHEMQLPVVQPEGEVCHVEDVEAGVHGAYFLMTPVGVPLTREHCEEHPRSIVKICKSLA